MTNSTQFIRYYHNVLNNTEMFRLMHLVPENSPWHRERNVGVHTDMVVSEYLIRVGNDWNHNDLLGAFVCAFHDVGKPKASEKNAVELTKTRMSANKKEKGRS